MSPARCRVLLALMLFHVGCMPYSTLGRARTLPANQWEIWVAPEAYIVAAEDGAAVRPTGEAGLRYGLLDGVEIDAQVNALGFGVGTRLQLMRSSNPQQGIDLALAPSVLYTAYDKVALTLPLLLGANLGEHQLVVTPRFAYQLRFGVGGQTAPVSFMYVGLSVGVALRIDAHVTLMPEVSAMTQAYADPGFATNLDQALGLTGALGLLLTP